MRSLHRRLVLIGGGRRTSRLRLARWRGRLLGAANQGVQLRLGDLTVMDFLRQGLKPWVQSFGKACEIERHHWPANEVAMLPASP